MNKLALLSLVMISPIIVLGACGIKPDQVDPPEEVQSGEFPRTYPATETDPPPFVKPQ